MAYLISRIRCNNILIWILLHLILEIRYARAIILLRNNQLYPVSLREGMPLRVPKFETLSVEVINSSPVVSA